VLVSSHARAIGLAPHLFVRPPRRMLLPALCDAAPMPIGIRPLVLALLYVWWPRLGSEQQAASGRGGQGGAAPPDPGGPGAGGPGGGRSAPLQGSRRPRRGRRGDILVLATRPHYLCPPTHGPWCSLSYLPGPDSARQSRRDFAHSTYQASTRSAAQRVATVASRDLDESPGTVSPQWPPLAPSAGEAVLRIVASPYRPFASWQRRWGRAARRGSSAPLRPQAARAPWMGAAPRAAPRACRKVGMSRLSSRVARPARTPDTAA
jgi:hypothetical protein